MRVGVLGRAVAQRARGCGRRESRRLNRPTRSVLTLGAFAAGLALSGCERSTASSSASTLQIAPPTTAEQAATTVVSTTTVPPPTTPSTTTLAPTTAPPSTTVEEQLKVAIERAQTAMRNCYASMPQPCDTAEIEAALVGAQLDRMSEAAATAQAEGYRVDDLKIQWKLLDEPRVINNELATATICRYDASVTVDVTGAVVNDQVQAFVQTWHLFPVDGDWKLGETINEKVMNDPTSNPCE